MLTRDPRRFNPGWVKVGGLRVANGIQHADFARRLHNQGIAHAIESAEYHRRSGHLVGQAHFLGKEAPIVERYIANDFARLEDAEHMTGLDAVARAAIEHDDLKLADDGNAVEY